MKVFSTAPQSSSVDRQDYFRRVIDLANWSERAGCEGILVYADNSLVDPWLVSQVIIQHTERLAPLIAVQPVYMHPYCVAKMVSTLAYFYGRRVYLNMVSGGFKNDLSALNDPTSHDERYARLVEYTTIILELLRSPAPVTYHGRFYSVDRLTMTPSLTAELMPGVFVSGSSHAGVTAALTLDATAIKYPQPAHDESDCLEAGLKSGIRVGIIARSNESEAWEVAHTRFPQSRKGQLTHQLAMKTSDSVWHRQLSLVATQEQETNTVYWLVPFENYKSFCPYLVGSYDRIAVELVKYIKRGYLTFILDIPPTEEELMHVNVVLRRATQMAQ